MGTKTKNIITIVLLLAVLFGFCGWSILKPDEQRSVTERRALAQFPELNGMFDDILGLGDVYAVSKVQLAKDYLSRKGYDPADTVFLGDTSHDAEVARAIGCRCLLISGGHQCDAVLRQVPGVEVLPSLRAAADVLGA